MMLTSVLLFLAELAAWAGPHDAAERVLAERCAKCHNAKAKMSDLDVTSRATAVKGGKQGAAIVPGKAAESRLWQYVSEGKMPPGQKLDETSLAAIRHWIEAGAPEFSGAAKKPFWAFQPPVKHIPPALDANPLDAFLLAKLREKGLDFNPPADQRTLIRRLYFDMTGLPPAPEDFRQTYEQAVDKVLASPRYGERWGRHWLDVVRFGETDGGEHNFERFNAWHYRDWVIESLNADKPYDRFIREQIAGDLLNPGDPKMVAATGFLVAGPWDSVSAVLNKDETLRQQARMDELDDMVTTTAHSFLALTVNCARCHDHKFDPISAKEYYSLTAFFSTVAFGDREVGTEEQRKVRDEFVRPLRKEMEAARRGLAEIEDPVRTKMLLERYQAFDRERAQEARRILLNAVWNRNQFAATKVDKVRFVVIGQTGRKPVLRYLELLPGGKRITDWTGAEAASADKPLTIELDVPAGTAVSGIRFASDPERGQREGMITTYRLEGMVGGEWRELCRSLDHVGRNELDLPELSDDDLEKALTDQQRKDRAALQARMDSLQKRMDAAPAITKLYAAKPKEPEKSFLLERGNVKRQVEEVGPGVLAAVQTPLPQVDSSDPAARRIALANWLADAKNPLTARVMVNRIWYHHFGNGIVNTPSDFGVNGDRPSHQELLDWLAVQFMENGWSMKWLHRQILLSRAYRQSSAMNDKAFAADAGNRLLWRMPLKRMDAEMVRDSLLAVVGNLDLRMGGPSYLLQKKGTRGSYIYKALEDGPETWRRAVYRFVVRGGERIMMDSFDCPDPSVATPQRPVSNTPVQALTLMNNEFVIRQAERFAERLQREAPDGRAAQIGLAYRLLFGREPNGAEVKRDAAFADQHSLAAWCRAILNSNEFAYVP
ncbi:MAG: PSD1 domain-containing protein [Acidobacteria bacterium]|nr:PSD1 domain-containing protein [Acidobacteriota bacterium]